MKQLTQKIVAIVAFTMLMPFPNSFAQAFRCGNTFQDHPCEGAEDGKTVRGVGPVKRKQNAALSGAAVHPACTKRGLDSQKIVWAREGGQLEEELRAEARGAEQKKLIADVYRVRGDCTGGTGENRSGVPTGA